MYRTGMPVFGSRHYRQGVKTASLVTHKQYVLDHLAQTFTSVCFCGIPEDFSSLIKFSAGRFNFL
jgi:hypothetical protein